ncbi:MAG: NADH:flavin oxidoreductase [Chloroflexi bacterium]|nr:NADH:flavin oxidoreductase [Chloroflexota bacterium]
MKLFSPITINGMRLENRIVMAPMLTRMPLGEVQETAYFVERARGGAGLIMFHAVSVEIASQPGFAETLQPLVEAVHREGAKISCQLSVSIHRPPHKRDYFRGERVGPSAVAGRRELTLAEIREIIAMYGPSAVNVREAGFDAVEIHGAHGLPPCIFFSPADNRRDDEYGGDVYRRMRFGLDIVASVRQAVGRDYPIIYRMAAEEERPDGITLPDAILFAKELEKAGVDCLSVSVGPSARPRNFISPPGAYPLGCYVYLAATVKPHVKVPVMAVGRINTPELAESVLAEGKGDLILMGRQLLCDPFWPAKVKAGRASEILYCSGCNHCATLYRGDVPLLCRLNKRVGHEWEMGEVTKTGPERSGRGA